ncbi:hypothetical protein [uncultured Fibrella sp.]|uniref:hypothetical protein n=1 Tax=uncultured Fibrella sp. TaxID=1284596 RepID=UPI0035CC0392
MKQIHLECKPDEVLVRALGFPRKVVNHHNDKGRVCNKLEKEQGAIGMIDEDPASPQPTYLKQLIEVENRHGIRLLKDDNRSHHVIVIRPRLEEWILTACARQQVDIKLFGLPDKPERLHQLVTSRLKQFNELIDHLHAVNCEPILRIQRLLNS